MNISTGYFQPRNSRAPGRYGRAVGVASGFGIHPSVRDLILVTFFIPSFRSGGIPSSYVPLREFDRRWRCFGSISPRSSRRQSSSGRNHVRCSESTFPLWKLNPGSPPPMFLPSMNWECVNYQTKGYVRLGLGVVDLCQLRMTAVTSSQQQRAYSTVYLLRNTISAVFWLDLSSVD